MSCPDSQHTNDQGECRSRSQDDELQQSTEGATDLDPSQRLDPTIYRRLNDALAQEQSDAPEHLQRLNELGALMRRWRIQRGATRQALASRLGMEVTQLTCLENGIAQTADISPGQLLALRELSVEDKADKLAAAIDSCLADFYS